MIFIAYSIYCTKLDTLSGSTGLRHKLLIYDHVLFDVDFDSANKPSESPRRICYEEMKT